MANVFERVAQRRHESKLKKHGLDLAVATRKAQPSSPAAAATVDKFKVYMKTVNTLDWDAVNALRPEWNTRWNKTVER